MLPNILLTAIGRVAASTSMLESALRHVVADLAGGDDAGWIIFEGQSVDWLIQNGIAVLGQHQEDEDGNSWRLGRFGRVLRDLFRAAEGLKNDRNLIIHGEWRTTCLGASINEPEFCRPRSSSSAGGDQVFHVLRSRYRKGFEEQAWTIANIEAVASAAEALARNVRSTYREAVDARHARWAATEEP